MASVASQPAADVSEPTTDVSVVTCGLEWTIGGMEGSGQSTRDRHLFGGGFGTPDQLVTVNESNLSCCRIRPTNESSLCSDS